MATDVGFPVGLVHLRLGPGAVACEPLFFPELARLGPTPDLAAAAVERALRDGLPKLPPGDLLRRRRAVAGRLVPFTLPLPPPEPTEAWRDPVALRFHAVVWDHDGHTLARVPALRIELIAGPKDDLDAVLKREALAAVRRLNLSTGLKPLAWAQTATAARLTWTTVSAKIPRLKERAVRAEADEPKKSVLHTVATPVRANWTGPAFEIDAVVSQLADALTAKPPQSVLLVGPSGVGKTAAVGELARRAADFRLGVTPFFRTSGARIVAGQTGFGMWEQRCGELVKEAAKKRAVLHLGNLVELMDVGKSECNPTGIASFLRPAIGRGQLLCVAECTPEQLPLIEKEDPQLLDAFRQITMEEPPPDAGRTILRRFAEADTRREPTADALAAVDRLHRRYATYSAYPGRPLRFLDRLRRDGPRGTPIPAAEVYAAFGRETGLPRPLIDPAVPLDVPATRGWFSARVVGQPDAVDIVTDLLATVKAGLARPNRPVASLLFVGPTGVGKTEMAKALAEFLFGSADRLTRFDMSEYADPVAVRRLVGGAFGSEGLLTAAVREQPFSVLLLDEVEKADRSAFDLLLQALGEARLTDAGGRLADFRNAVVILTSNLGAESFRAGRPGFGGGTGPADAAAHFARAVEQFLRPEMVNRLDRVVPFAPLGPDVIRRIADREWNKVLARDGVRFRGLTVTAAPGLLDRIAATGFDPKYGARPLKHAMERELLAPLARQVNRHPGDTPLTADVAASDAGLTVTVRPVQGAAARTVREPASPLGRVAVEAQDLRRWNQLLERATVVRDVENEAYQLEAAEARLRRRQAAGKPARPGEPQILARLGQLRDLLGEVLRQRAASAELEDDALVAFYTDAATPDLTDRLARQRASWDDLLFRLYAHAHPADRVTLALFAEHRTHLTQLAEAYLALTVASQHKLSAAAFAYLPVTPAESDKELAKGLPKFPRDRDPATAWLREHLFERKGDTVRAVLRATRVKVLGGLDVPATAVGVALVLTGPAAGLRFLGEAGLHKFVGTPAEEGNPDVLVAATRLPVGEYLPPVEVVRKGAIKADKPRRVYDRERGRVDDKELGEGFANLWGDLAAVLEPVLAANTRARLRAVATD